MLQIKNLSIYLIEDNRTILDDFNFTLNENDKVALIGEEGNGKSVLLKTIYNKEELKNSFVIKGEIYKNNEVLGYLPQTIDEKYLELGTYEYINIKINESFIDYNLLYKYLNIFNLNEEIISNNIKIKYLSGGEKIKFILLVEMLKSPTILLLDEPSNDLDYNSVLWLEKFMLETNLPMIFISHDNELLSNVANKIIHLEQTHRRTISKYTISKNSYEDYISKRKEYIETETNKSKKEHEEFSKKINRYRRVHDSVQHALRNTKNDVEGKNLKDKMHVIKSMGKRLDKEEKNLTKEPDYEESIGIFFDDYISIPNSKIILNFNLPKLIAGDKILSQNISLKIIGPEKICIIGKNGAGKSTLIKIFIKELENLNLKVGYMPQNYFEFEKNNISAIDYLSISYTKDEHTKISTYLGSLNFKREEMYRNISQLSGGQKAKLFFAKMNLDKAEVLILDEPTRNISPLSQSEIIEALKDYKGAIIAVSHDRNFINEVFDKVYELDVNGLHRKNY